MKSSKLFSMAVLATAVAAVTGLTACSSSPSIETVVVPPASESELTISLHPVDTRAAATGISTEKENTVNRVAVGIFDSNGKAKVVQTFERAAITSGKVSLTTTTTLSTTDHVLVACNAPADRFTGSITDEAAFRARTLTLDEALYGAGADSHATTDAVDFTNLPMFGHAEGLTQSSTDATQFTASVSAYHLVAKVTVEEMNTAFSGALAGASFEPEGIFLAHVPGQLDFQNVVATGSEAKYESSLSVAGTTYYHGDLSNKKDGGSFLGKAYLGMDATEANGTKTVKGLVAYTMPNSQTDDAHATFLVIKGTFHSSATDKTGTAVWYPLYLNYSSDGANTRPVGDAKKVYPNFNYRMRITIKGFGESRKYDGNGNPVITPLSSGAATVFISPQDFVDAASEVTVE